MPQTVLADDHADFRGFARRLEAVGTVLGEAEDGTSVLAAVEEPRPDLTLLDAILSEAPR